MILFVSRSGYCLYSELISLQDGSVSIQEKFEYIMYGRLYDITADGLTRSPPEVYVNVSHVILLYYSILFSS